MRQHLTALQAAASICNAAIEGAAIGSQAVAFSPGKVVAGDYTFAIGSAGSATLVLQTVLPALLCAREPSRLTLEGGTHNPHAPPVDFLERAFVPLLNRMGPVITVCQERAGFYPAGGGRFTVEVSPCEKLAPLHLPERGEITRRLASASVAALPGEIARRELNKVEQRLGWSGEQLQIRQLPEAWGPGNVLTLEIQSEHVTEVFSGFGEKRVTAEQVADEAIGQARDYLAAGVPVGQHLADQLLLPLALAGGGSFLTHSPTRHTMTNIEIIRRFLSVRIHCAGEDGGRWRIEIGQE
jgi:RNA 3'-terminal phosphate cyclase (ATP)